MLVQRLETFKGLAVVIWLARNRVFVGPVSGVIYQLLLGCKVCLPSCITGRQILASLFLSCMLCIVLNFCKFSLCLDFYPQFGLLKFVLMHFLSLKKSFLVFHYGQKYVGRYI